jgi:hypothetical protein
MDKFVGLPTEPDRVSEPVIFRRVQKKNDKVVSIVAGNPIFRAHRKLEIA